MPSARAKLSVPNRGPAVENVVDLMDALKKLLARPRPRPQEQDATEGFAGQKEMLLPIEEKERSEKICKAERATKRKAG